MGVVLGRTVEIKISNKTQTFTLENPRTYFFSGRNLIHPEHSVAPGTSKSCRFSNSTSLWGCNGVLAYEAQDFTLAIYFSNPVDYNRFSPELGLEISLDKIHLGDLKVIYTRMVRRSHPDPSERFAFQLVSLKGCQEPAQLSLGPVSVTATMSDVRDAVIDVAVEERGRVVVMGAPCEGEDIQA